MPTLLLDSLLFVLQSTDGTGRGRGLHRKLLTVDVEDLFLNVFLDAHEPALF
jgi:hypothetical protein